MTERASARRVCGLTLALGAVAFLSAIALYPSPSRVLSEHGQGYQLAAAAEILGGRHPFLDFKDTYGPLTYYASALAQALSGGRVVGELLLVAGALALSYALLFRLMLACAIGPGIATVATLAAIAIQPAGYRYYLCAWPIVFLAAGFRYAAAPTRLRLAGMALATTVAGLFRPDLGVYCFVTGLVMIAATRTGRTWRDAGIYAALTLAWALPWLGWVAAQGELGAYLRLSSVEAMQEAAGRTRPVPWLDFSGGVFTGDNAKAFLFRLPILVSVFAAVMLWARRAELHGAQRARLLGVFAYALLCLPQAAHIVDWIHVRDVLPLRVLLLAWIAAGAWQAAERSRPFARRATLAASAGLALAPVAAALKQAWASDTRPWLPTEKIRALAVTRRELLDRVEASGANYRATVYKYVRDRSAPHETILALIEAPQINYFAERALASRQMAIFPGYFARPEDQRALIADLRRKETAFVVLDHTKQDDNPEIDFARFAPEVKAFLEAEFRPVKQIGYIVVLAPKGRVVAP